MKGCHILPALERGLDVRRSIWPANRIWRLDTSLVASGQGPVILEIDTKLDRRVGRATIEAAQLFKDDWELASGQGTQQTKG